MPNKNLFAIYLVVLMILAACNGGSSSDSSFSPPQFELSLSGKLTYTFYPVTVASGIDYEAEEARPIRGAVVEIQNSVGGVLSSSNSGADGSYSLGIPDNQQVRLVVKASLGSPGNPSTEIRDNTDGDALYALFQDLDVLDADIELDLHAESGWNGVTYSGTRAAAPFAILDTLYEAQQFILAAEPTALFPLLRVFWSPENREVEGDRSLGEIGGTFYSGREIWLLGAENLDTEEYDKAVILHEWAHYYEDVFSRSDSIGGPHAIGELLDLTVAFSEGFANAFSGLVRGDPQLLDSVGSQQSSLGVVLDLEADFIDDNLNDQGLLVDGFYSEASVQELLFDIGDAPSSDDDSLAIPFQIWHQVFTGGHRQTAAFTSIFSFIEYLKLSQPNLSAEITMLAANENIPAGDEYEGEGSPFLYTDVFTSGSWVMSDVNGDLLRTRNIYGEIEDDFVGNHHLNRVFFKIAPLSSGCFRFEVDPLAQGDLAIFVGRGFLDEGAEGVMESLFFSAAVGQPVAFAVASFADVASFRVRALPVQSGC